MSYKIYNLPSSRAYIEELADFWEVEALRNPDQSISKVYISSIIDKELDEIRHDGIESEDDQVTTRFDEVFVELERRKMFTNDKYPFTFETTSLKINSTSTVFRTVYLYLLCCTRFNMQTDKSQNGIDGTLLFEKLCAYVAKKYFGTRSNSFVFGTGANTGSFADKINDLIQRIGEGGHFTNPNNNSPTQNDAGVDVVAWIDFADERRGKLIAFGQCKTGTSWSQSLRKSELTNFCQTWFSEQPLVPPIPIVFIADTLYRELNFASVQMGGLFFNRFRILEYIENDLDADILSKIEQWVDGALASVSISL